MLRAAFGIGCYTLVFWAIMYFFGVGTEAGIIIASLLIPQVWTCMKLEMTSHTFMLNVIILLVNFIVMLFVTFLTASYGIFAQFAISFVAGLLMTLFVQVVNKALE